MNNDKLREEIEAIIDNHDIDQEDKIVLCARLTAIYMTEINAGDFSMKLGDYKVNVIIEKV